MVCYGDVWLLPPKSQYQKFFIAIFACPKRRFPETACPKYDPDASSLSPRVPQLTLAASLLFTLSVSAPRTPPAFIPAAAQAVICEQPASCQLWEFKPLVLRCVARGQPPLTYAWYKNERRLVQFTEPELVVGFS